MTTYRVLKGISNDKTGKSHVPGDIVKAGDYPVSVLRAWARKEPPVVEELTEDKEELEDGSNTSDG